jgi:predicted TIM-barrel fold metal-dependent hydrolase
MPGPGHLVKDLDMHVIDMGTLFGVRPATDLDLTPEALLRVMARNEVGHALTCSLKAIQFDSRAGNDQALALCRAHPNLYPVAVVDPRQGPDCLAEVERCASAGFVAFRLFPDFQGWAIASQSFRHLLRAIAQTGLPAIVHAPASGDATALLDIAGEWETPIVLAAISYSVLAEALAVLAEAPHFYVEAHRVALPGQVELMVESVGAERIMFGSWAPWFAQRPSLDMVLGSEVSQADQSRILGANARRLFGLAGRETG